MADKVDIWMPLYPRDYLADTGRLTTEQHGAYLLLILDYWMLGALPDDDDTLKRITKMSAESWATSGRILRAMFTKGPDGRLFHTLNKLIAEMRQEQRNSAARATLKFVACGKETGARGKPGWSRCSGGMIMFEAVAYGSPDEDGQRKPMYNGEPQTFAKDCDCLIAWRTEKAKRG